MKKLTCFKSYDIRGKLGEELCDDVAYRIGRAYAQHLKAKSVVIGCDVRLTSDALKQAVSNGLRDAGCDVIDIGTTGTEEVYFAAFNLDVDGGIEITASHNPLDHNGMKLVGRGAKPISGDSGLREIQKIAEEQKFSIPPRFGQFRKISILQDYIKHLLGYINPSSLRGLKIVVNSGNGAAGHVIDALEDQFNQNNIPFEFIKIHHQPDGNFPNGIPNPLLVENRTDTSEAVKKHGADFGVAWDGDFDRCFLFDERGDFIDGYYIVGLLSETFLQKFPNETIIYDPRLTWNTIDIVRNAGGKAVQCKSGHSFIKERMRAENAIYGGEMSAHHYFRDFAYCDSGMIPWLLMAELISIKSCSLSELVNDRMTAYPCSGEINYRVENPQSLIERVKAHYAKSRYLKNIDATDGISIEFSNWRFNLRASNTEPLLRLNVEAIANRRKVNECVMQIETIINQGSADTHCTGSD